MKRLLLPPLAALDRLEGVSNVDIYAESEE